MRNVLTSGRVAFMMRTLLAVGAVLSIVVVVCKALDVEIETEQQKKRLDVDVAEGVRLYNPKAGVDSVRIGSCRIEKMRSGPIAFGGLNVLIVRDLELNLPLSRGNSSLGITEKSARPQGEGRALAERLGLSDEILALSGVKGRKFSGIRIAGLRVNRTRNRTAEPLFAARSCRNRGRKLVLDGCEVYSAGGDESRGRGSTGHGTGASSAVERRQFALVRSPDRLPVRLRSFWQTCQGFAIISHIEKFTRSGDAEVENDGVAVRGGNRTRRVRRSAS